MTQAPGIPSILPMFYSVGRLADRKLTKNEVIQFFIISIFLLAALGLGYAAYCTYKGGSFYYAVKLSAFYLKFACIMH